MSSTRTKRGSSRFWRRNIEALFRIYPFAALACIFTVCQSVHYHIVCKRTLSCILHISVCQSVHYHMAYKGIAKTCALLKALLSKKHSSALSHLPHHRSAHNHTAYKGIIETCALLKSFSSKKHSGAVSHLPVLTSKTSLRPKYFSPQFTAPHFSPTDAASKSGVAQRFCRTGRRFTKRNVYECLEIRVGY